MWKKFDWKVSLFGALLMILMFMISLRFNKSPYPEFESNLKKQICECVSLTRLTNENNFLEEYEKCTKATSELLKSGLDSYPENPDISKEVYLETLPKLILKFSKNCSK